MGNSYSGWIIGFVVIIIAFGLFINSNKEEREMVSGSCKTDLECNSINLTFATTGEKISLPTHCMNIFNKNDSRCAWLWPEGLYELIDLDAYVDRADSEIDTTTNLRDWMKSNKDIIHTPLDLNKLPQHHQTIEIIKEDMCPVPFMDFIPLGSLDTSKEGQTLEKNDSIAKRIRRTSETQSIYPQIIDQTFGVCAVSASNVGKVFAQLGLRVKK